MVTLLLVNMLIAMMGNTYQLVNETQKEWFRQVFNSGILISNTWCETNVVYQEYLMYMFFVYKKRNTIMTSIMGRGQQTLEYSVKIEQYYVEVKIFLKGIMCAYNVCIYQKL